LRRSDQRGAGVGDHRCTCVADVGHALAAREPHQHLGGGGMFIVLVQRQQRLGQAEVAEQRATDARVLAGDGINQA